MGILTSKPENEWTILWMGVIIIAKWDIKVGT